SRLRLLSQQGLPHARAQASPRRARTLPHPPAQLRARRPIQPAPVTARRALGDFGERIAAHRLEADGLVIAARNVRTPSGEVDLIARDGPETGFVTVRHPHAYTSV